MGTTAATASPDAAGFRTLVTPFLRTHCLRCHGPDKQGGEFRVDEHLPNDFRDRTAREKKQVLGDIKRAYATEAVKTAARKYGWAVKADAEQDSYTIARRTL